MLLKATRPANGRSVRAVALSLALLLGPCPLGLAQGKVWFSNRVRAVVPNVDAPFFDAQGVPLSGPDYVAQLYAGAGPESLAPFGTPTPFRSVGQPFGPGYFHGDDVVVPRSVIPSIGGPVWVQVRAWNVTDGPTYEQAAGAGAWTGVSNILYLPQTGVVDADPPDVGAPLIGLRFLGVPEPASAKLLLLALAILGLARDGRWRRPPTHVAKTPP